MSARWFLRAFQERCWPAHITTNRQMQPDTDRRDDADLRTSFRRETPTSAVGERHCPKRASARRADRGCFKSQVSPNHGINQPSKSWGQHSQHSHFAPIKDLSLSPLIGVIVSPGTAQLRTRLATNGRRLALKLQLPSEQCSSFGNRQQAQLSFRAASKSGTRAPAVRHG
jgi:hypothetical protein